MNTVNELNILIVDDDKNVRLVLKELIEEHNFSVTAVGSADEAVIALDSICFDVVLLDFHMPGRGGDEVLRYIRSIPELSCIAVILVSASREAELDLLDVYDFIAKPVNFTRLFKDLDEILSWKRLKSDRDPAINCVENFSDALFDSFATILDEKVGLSIPYRRKSELARVVCSRVRALLLSDFESYRRHLSSTAGEGELKKLILLMTIGETYFFRNSAHFTALSENVFPQLKKDLIIAGQKNVRILSCGCSTGEEAYSLAIAAKKFFPSAAEWNLSVTAIDINDRSIRQAEDAIFSGRSFRAADSSLKKDYFLPSGNQWKVSRRIKELVIFRCYNICDLGFYPVPMWLKNMDIIFCRNVMIYFVRHRINTIIDSFHDMLLPGGHLFLGHSENRFATEPGFAPVIDKETIYFERRAIDGVPEKNIYRPSTGTRPASGTYRPSSDTHPASGTYRPSTGTRPATGTNNCYIPDDSNYDSTGDALTEKQITHLFESAIEMIGNENFKGAAELRDRISKTCELHPMLMVLSAFILSNQGQDQSAIKLIDKALKQDIGLSYAYYLRGIIKERQFQMEEASQDFISATRWKADFIMAHVKHGFLLEKMGQSQSANEWFRKALVHAEENRFSNILFSGRTSGDSLKAMLKEKVR